MRTANGRISTEPSSTRQIARSNGHSPEFDWGFRALTRAPSLDRLTHASAAVGRPKYGVYQEKVVATGFEPATFRPPAEWIQATICLGASVVSYLSRAVDDLDR